MISGRTRVVGLVGDPLEHSLSPTMHNAAFRVLGLDAVYVPLPCREAEVPLLMRYLASRGGGGNVTVPHKAKAAAAVQTATALVTQTGACNTFWGEGGALLGDNTDVAGILAALEQLEVPDAPWLLAGTGGAARAVAAAAAVRGVPLSVRSREPSRGAAFEAWCATLGVARAEAASCTTLINATPIGLAAGDGDAIPFDLAPAAVAALDLVYARGQTPWIRRARARGLRARDGREMLVQQGAAAFARWFPGSRAPVDAMRGAVHAALG
jgi:shikimate dehydrogenase